MHMFHKNSMRSVLLFTTFYGWSQTQTVLFKTKCHACNKKENEYDEATNIKWKPDFFLLYIITLVLFDSILTCSVFENTFGPMRPGQPFQTNSLGSLFIITDCFNKFTFGFHVDLYVMSNCQLFKGKCTGTIKAKKDILWIMLEVMSFCHFRFPYFQYAAFLARKRVVHVLHDTLVRLRQASEWFLQSNNGKCSLKKNFHVKKKLRSEHHSYCTATITIREAIRMLYESSLTMFHERTMSVLEISHHGMLEERYDKNLCGFGRNAQYDLMSELVVRNRFSW